MKKEKKKDTNKQISFVVYIFLFMFLALVAYFVYFQEFLRESFINSPYNSLQNLFEEHIIRGDILSSDGEILATTKVDSDGNERRVYPKGRTFAHVVGYSVNGKMGIEKQYNFNLLRSHSFFLSQVINDLKDQKNDGDTLITTLDSNLQGIAYKALGDYDGAVIAMQPSTGKILCMVSKPDFDPNTVASDWETINSEGSSVLVNRATNGKYAPGSIFKIFSTLEYYNENKDSYTDYSFECSGEFTFSGQTIHCAANEKHGSEDLKLSFANSCNASYANLALSIDPDKLLKRCNGLLFNQDLPVTFDSSKSKIDISKDSTDSFRMETVIGQGDTLVSPLHMLLVMSAIDNDGILMSPYMVDSITNKDGDLISKSREKEVATYLTEDELKVLRKYLRAVVTDGTATELNSSEYTAFGKTGTAEVSDGKDKTNAWFVGYAKKADKEDIAIAVIVEDSGYASKYAVPIAKKIFEAY